MSPKMIGAYLGASPVDMARLGSVKMLPARPGWEPSFPAPVTVATGGHNAFPGLAMLASGTLYAAWRAGSQHAGGADGVIKAATSTDNGATWSTATTILSEASVDYRDPTLAMLSDGRIACQFFKYVSGTPTGVFVAYSSDNGATWGAPASIPFGFTGWAACSGPIAEPTPGTLVACAYGKDTAQKFTSVRAIVSTDNGATWGSDTLLATGTLSLSYEEPFAGTLSDGRTMVHIRATDGIRRRVFRSAGGVWGNLSTVYSGVQARPSWLQIDSGRIIMGDRYKPSSGNTSVVALATGPDDSPTEFIAHGAVGETLGAYQQFVTLADGRVGMLYACEFSNTSATLYFRSLTRARQPAVSTYAAEVAADSPAASWGFDDTTGTTLAEDGGTHPGVLVNSPTLGTSPLVRDGGTAIAFDGTNDYFTVAHNAALNASGAFTIEAWVKCDTPTADRFWPIVSKSNYSGSNGQWSITYDNRVSQSSPQRLRFIAGSDFGAGVLDWTGCAGDMALGGHLVCTASGAGSGQTLRIYWNGSLVRSLGGATVTWSAGNTMAIDSHTSTLYFDGTLDAFSIYHAELSAARVLAHYRAGVTT